MKRSPIKDHILAEEGVKCFFSYNKADEEIKLPLEYRVKNKIFNLIGVIYKYKNMNSRFYLIDSPTPNTEINYYIAYYVLK